MPDSFKNQIKAAEIVLPCSELDTTLEFFTEKLGFRINAIFPADAPEESVISGHGIRIRLKKGGTGSPGRLRLLCRNLANYADVRGNEASALSIRDEVPVLHSCSTDLPYSLTTDPVQDK